MKTIVRPATIFFTVVIALTALLGASAQAVSTTAGRHMVATAPRTLLDVTSSTKRMLAIESTIELGQQVAARQRVL